MKYESVSFFFILTVASILIAGIFGTFDMVAMAVSFIFLAIIFGVATMVKFDRDRE